MPLQTLYRPETLDEFYGNEALKKSLQSVLDREKDIPQAFLFTGPSGCGKSSLARVVKKRLKIDDGDYHFYNTANTRGIDTIREIVDNAPYFSLFGSNKMYVFEECHQLTVPSMEALLDVLENPPNHTYFVLCTTDPQKLKQTLKRRCYIGTVESLDDREIDSLLTDVLRKEQVEVSDRIRKHIIDHCDGSPGIALSLLDSVIDMEEKDEDLAIEAITVGVPDLKVIELCRALVKPKAKWSEVQKVLEAINIRKIEPENIRLLIVGYFTTVMLNDPSDRIADVSLCFTGSFVESRGLGLVLACWEACKL